MKLPEENLKEAQESVQEPATEADAVKIAKIDNIATDPAQEAERSLEAASPGKRSLEAASPGEVREAYLRGRNEAIAEALGRDGEHPLTAPRNHTPGIEDPYTPPSDPTLAAIFTFRPSVWQ